MKTRNFLVFLTSLILVAACSSQKKLAYLNNLPENGGEGKYEMNMPEYKLQPRDILYITIKAMTPDGTIRDYLTSTNNAFSSSLSGGEAGGYLYGYNIDLGGNIILPAIGPVNVNGLSVEEARKLLQEKANRIFNGATVECKLLSYKFTVIGEVRSPGAYFNYNNYLTVLEAIGRAGGMDDFGRRDRVLVVRQFSDGTKTFTLNLQDKKILSSSGYFLLPNDVVIVEPQSKKIFNLNLPTFSFILTSVTSAITTTILLINYLGK